MKLNLMVGEKIKVGGAFNEKILLVAVLLVALVGSAIAFGNSGGLGALSLSPGVPSPGHDWGQIECVDCITQDNLATDAVQEDELYGPSVLAELLPIDGTGSGLDSDFLDGLNAADFLAAQTGGVLWCNIVRTASSPVYVMLTCDTGDKLILCRWSYSAGDTDIMSGPVCITESH